MKATLLFKRGLDKIGTGTLEVDEKFITQPRSTA